MGSGWIGLVPCTVVQYISLVRAWPSTHQDGEEKTERGQTLEEPVNGPIRRPEGNEARKQRAAEHGFIGPDPLVDRGGLHILSITAGNTKCAARQLTGLPVERDEQ
jgi:hypothetical protein